MQDKDEQLGTPSIPSSRSGALQRPAGWAWVNAALSHPFQVAHADGLLAQNLDGRHTNLSLKSCREILEAQLHPPGGLAAHPATVLP